MLAGRTQDWGSTGGGGVASPAGAADARAVPHASVARAASTRLARRGFMDARTHAAPVSCASARVPALPAVGGFMRRAALATTVAVLTLGQAQSAGAASPCTSVDAAAGAAKALYGPGTELVRTERV